MYLLKYISFFDNLTLIIIVVIIYNLTKLYVSVERLILNYIIHSNKSKYNKYPVILGITYIANSQMFLVFF